MKGWSPGLALLLVAAGASWADGSSNRPPAEPLPALKEGNARVVFVGDSITGLGGGWKGVGFTFPMSAALRAVYPDCQPQLLALGGSGMGVRNWVNLLRRPLKTGFFLDVKGLDVRETLSQPADVLIVLLGMNDVLAPYVGHTAADQDRWQEQYRQLVVELRARLQPAVVGLASITMQTEDPRSAKNQLIAALNERIRTLATEVGARYLPVNETIWEVHRCGRSLDPNFHTTYDLIHPNKFGQLAIAIGMLRGLGEETAADHIEREKFTPLLQALRQRESFFSYEVLPDRLRYWWHGPARTNLLIRLEAPPGWTVEPAAMAAPRGEFRIQTRSYLLQNRLHLRDGDGMVREVIVPAPWRVITGWVHPGWEGGRFPEAKIRSAVDRAIEQGEDFVTAARNECGSGTGWQIYFPSINYKGGANPGSVDFAAVTHARNFEAGYGARWILSEAKRDLHLRLFTEGLAARVHLTVWLNREKVFSDLLTKQPRTVAVKLRAGANTLVFRSSHRTWEWQNTIELVPLNGENLDDLRIVLEPPPL